MHIYYLRRSGSRTHFKTYILVSSCSVRVHLLNGEGTNKWPFDNKCVLLGRHFGRTAFLESAKNVLNYLTWTRLRASLQIAFHAWFAFASIVLQDRIPIFFLLEKNYIYVLLILKKVRCWQRRLIYEKLNKCGMNFGCLQK